MTRRSQFGSIRRLPSGRYQARFTEPGTDRLINAPHTFTTRGDAQGWLAVQRGKIVSGTWKRKEVSPLTVGEYAAKWLAEKTLRPTTREHYQLLLDCHILPVLGGLQLAKLDAATVRTWYSRLDTGPVMKAHVYVLLSGILKTAVEDNLITASPCTIKGAGRVKRTRKIKPATVDELAVIVEHMPPRYRLLVHLAAWCALRYGELAELRRKDIDLRAGVIRVRRGVTWAGGEPVIGPPKSEAGIRDVVIPPHVIPLIREHLAAYPGLGEALLFPAPRGAHMSHQRFYTWWQPAREAAGRPDLRVHDLRHTGAVMAARSGYTIKELMDRLGHSTASMALNYQHAASEERAKALAAKLSEMATGDA